MDQTDAFYTSVFEAMYPNFVRFQSDLLNFQHDAAQDFPVDVNFDATTSFTEGTEAPTVQEMLQVMLNADYRDYIQNYVWETSDANAFFNVEFVNFRDRKSVV